MRTAVPVDSDELKWRRREDARALARAEEIRADKERLKQAHLGAKEILEEENRRLDSMAKVAGMKVRVVNPDPSNAGNIETGRVRGRAVFSTGAYNGKFTRYVD